MGLSELLEIRPGITSVIGGGGKTTLLRTLGEELAGSHRVLLCTTTKIFPFPGIPCAESGAELRQLCKEHPLICAGQRLPDREKLTVPAIPFSRLAEWFDYVLVEADGAARRPLKAHGPREPVIPPESGQTVCVVGASGFGRPIGEAVHRPELFAALAGAEMQDAVTVGMEAAVLNAEAFHQRVYVSQVETETDRLNARALAALLDCPVLAGSLRKGEYFQCLL